MKILEFGNTDNKKLILMHGYEVPYQILNDYIEYYKKDFHVIVPVLPGHDGEGADGFISFNNSAEEFEDWYINKYNEEIHAIYAMSMGGVFVSHIWQHNRIKINKLIMESSPLLPFNKLMTKMLTKNYLNINAKARARDEKTLKEAGKSLFKPEQKNDFLKLIDNFSDEATVRYLNDLFPYKFPPDNKTDTHIYYFYGGVIAELPFKQVAKYIKKNYPDSKIVCFKKKAHCIDAIMHPEVRIPLLNEILY